MWWKVMYVTESDTCNWACWKDDTALISSPSWILLQTKIECQFSSLLFWPIFNILCNGFYWRPMVKISGDMTISFPAAFIPLLLKEEYPSALKFDVHGTNSLEQIIPNKKLIEKYVQPNQSLLFVDVSFFYQVIYFGIHCSKCFFWCTDYRSSWVNVWEEWVHNFLILLCA